MHLIAKVKVSGSGQNECLDLASDTSIFSLFIFNTFFNSTWQQGVYKFISADKCSSLGLAVFKNPAHYLQTDSTLTGIQRKVPLIKLNLKNTGKWHELLTLV